MPPGARPCRGDVLARQAARAALSSLLAGSVTRVELTTVTTIDGEDAPAAGEAERDRTVRLAALEVR